MAQMIVRITGSGFVKQGAVTPGHPVQNKRWEEVLDDCDAVLEAAVHSEEEEAVVELWLEDPESFQVEEDGTPAPAPKRGTVTRVNSNFGTVQRGDVSHKVAGQRWDSEFADAQAHAASVLGKLGNGR